MHHDRSFEGVFLYSVLFQGVIFFSIKQKILLLLDRSCEGHIETECLPSKQKTMRDQASQLARSCPQGANETLPAHEAPMMDLCNKPSANMPS